MLSFLNPYMLYFKLACGVGLALFAGWAFRVNHLRDVHEQQLAVVAKAVKTAGYPKNGFDNLAGDIGLLATDRDTYKQNAKTSQDAVDSQNLSISALGAKEADAEQASAVAQQKVAAVVADRDQWMASAKALSTRTTRKSSDAELLECTATMDAIYTEGL